MTRSEHMAWCKQRALSELESSGIMAGFSSMLSDLRKHPEIDDYIAIEVGTSMLLAGMLKSKDEMSKFINGFN